MTKKSDKNDPEIKKKGNKEKINNIILIFINLYYSKQNTSHIFHLFLLQYSLFLFDLVQL